MYKEQQFNLGRSWRKNDEEVSERKKGQFDVINQLLRQNEYAKIADKGKTNFRVLAGEIYEVDFGINVNAEFSYRHYALVLADSLENNPLVLICPLKSNNKGAHPASDINLGMINDLYSDHESLAVINQIRTIDKLRIFRCAIIRGEKLYDSDYYEFEGKHRLEPTKFQMVKSKMLDYLKYGYLDQKQ